MSQAVLDALEHISENENDEVREGASGGTVGSLEEVEVEEEDDSIQAVKVKKPRTQKQIDAFAGVIAKRTLAREARAGKRKEVSDEAERKAIEDKKILDAKIIKKAINLTKRKIREERILDDEDMQETRVSSHAPSFKGSNAPPPKLQIHFV